MPKNNNNKLAVILIIAHKNSLTVSEQSSLIQCYKILSNYRIVLICPKNLNIQHYKKLVPEIEIDFINPKWQSNYRMFNRLKINPLLYKRYKEYKYILFYELDAWVFKDELAYWCNQGYDYIGAPWYDGYSTANEESAFVGVGNGGFSLRKTKSHLKALYTFSYIVSPKMLFDNLINSNKLTIRKIVSFIFDLTIRNNTFYLFNKSQLNEDSYWCFIIAKKFNWFKIPGEEIASKFSTELNSKMLYFKNNKQLPFGCHAWEKYDSEFWSNYINENFNLS